MIGELKAIYVGLQIICERDWKNIVISSDSKQAVALILQESCVKDENFLIIVQHGARSTNRVSDLLAKTCRKLDNSNYAKVVLNQAP